MKRFKKYPLFISLVLLAQLFLPAFGVFAAEHPAPTNFKVYETYPGYVTFEWDAVPYSKGYRVYQLEGEKKKLVSEVTKNRAYLSLSEGSYTFAVAAVSSSNLESRLSNNGLLEVVYPDMQAPSNVQAKVENIFNLTLSWESVNYAQVYNIYKVINGNRTLVGTTTNKTSAAFNILPEGIHEYEITAYNYTFGESAAAGKVTVNIDYPEMQPPTNLSYTITNGNDLTLNWNAAENAHNYKIYKINGTEKVLITTTSNKSYTLKELSEGEHIFEVASYNNWFKESVNKAQAKVNLVYPEMFPPANMKFSLSNGNDGTLSWDPVPYATAYNVYQIIDGSRVLVEKVHYNYQQLKFSNLAEGNYIYEVTAYSDRFGESKTSSRLEQLIVHPEMKSPEGLTGNIIDVNNLMLTWKNAEYADGYNLYKIVNGQRELISKINNTFNYFTNLPEGQHVYEVTSYSNRFGESLTGSKVEKEIIFPEMKAPNLDGSVAGNGITLWWSKTENATTYNLYQIVDGERKFIKSIPNIVAAFYEMPVGEYVYEITAYNGKFGESPASNQVTLYVEPKLEAPTTPKASVNGDDVVLTWDPVKDADSYNVYEEVDGEQVLVGNTSDPELALEDLEQGEHTYIIVPVSPTGKESGSSSTVVVEVGENDTTAPVTESNVVDKWYREAVPVELTATDDLSGVAKTFYSVNGSDFIEGASFVVSEAGVTTVSFYSVDNVGNVEEVKTVEVKFDNTPPVTTSNVTDQWLNESFSVKLTATDDLSGVEKTYYSVNGSEYVSGATVFVSDPGVNIVSFFSVDKAGNVETEVKTVEVKIDKTAPETVSNVTDQWNQGEVAVELTATDDHSGVAQTFYSINGSEFVEGTTFTVTEEGVNEVSFYSVDNVGNVEEAKTVEVKIDKMAPETVSNVTDQWNQGEVAVELTATDALSGVAKTFYSINGTEFVEGTAFTVTEEGVNKVSFYSVDNAGNVEEVKTVEVKIDTEAPETVSNVTDQWNKGEVAVELTATDALSGVAKTFYSINSSEFVEGTKFTVTEEGVNKVSFYSVDNAGNVEEVKTVEVKIDANAPETASNVSDQWNKGEVAVELTATDALSGVAKTFYSINGLEFVEGTTFTVSEEGVNKVSFYSVDNAGNVEEAKTVEVKIDKTAPTVSIPLASEQALGSTFTVDYLAEDNLSGIAVEEITLNGKTYKKGDQITLDEPGSYKLVVKVTDAAGWTTQIEKEFVVYIPATLEVLPKVIKGNKGVFTVKANLPAEYQSLSFDVSNVTLNGVVADPKNNGLQKQAEKGHFKFEREDFDWEKGEVTLELRGYLDNGILVIAQKTVEVK